MDYDVPDCQGTRGYNYEYVFLVDFDELHSGLGVGKGQLFLLTYQPVHW